MGISRWTNNRTAFTILEWYQFISMAAGRSHLPILPVGIVWSVSRKMGTSQILGIVLGICLVSPQLLNAYNVASTPAAEIAKKWVWILVFFTVRRIGLSRASYPSFTS